MKHDQGFPWVPVGLGVAAGVGVGVVLGRTVFAPRTVPSGAIGKVQPLPPGQEWKLGKTVEEVEQRPTSPWTSARSQPQDAPQYYDSPELVQIAARAKMLPFKQVAEQISVPPGLDRPTPRAWRTIDELLLTPPSEEERHQIREDFNILFEFGLFGSNAEENWRKMLAVYNTFRVMRALEFDAPIPLLGTTNVYDYLLGLRHLAAHELSITYVLSDPENGGSAACDRAGDSCVINVNASSLGEPYMTQWYEPRSGVGLQGVLGLFVHEGRHLQGYGHGPGGCAHAQVAFDRLSAGGPFAAQYWYLRWCAEHSGSLLTLRQKEVAANDARQLLETRICGGLAR